MAKSNVKKKFDKSSGSNKKGMLKFWIGIVVVLVLLFIGLRVYNTYPQAPYSQISSISSTYNEELIGLKTTLVDKYNECSTSKDLEAWKTFSQDWISKIGIASPNEFGMRLSDKSMDLVNAAKFMSRDLFQLWTEYNTALETGTAVDEAKEKALLESIDNGHEFIVNKTK